MFDGVLHQGLNGKHRNGRLQRGIGHVDLHTQTVAEAGLLHFQISPDNIQFFR